jgi:GAF domain-containing protein
MVPVPRNKDSDSAVLILIQDIDGGKTFSDSDVRLLETLANSMSVALQNAQSFKAEQERVAELAIINSVQAALAAELNIQGIYEAVGDKTREIFHQADVVIRIYDPQTNLIHFPYLSQDGERMTVESFPLAETGFGSHVIRTRQTLVINEDVEQAVEKYGSRVLPGTEMPKSQVLVPLVAGDQARGLIEIVDVHREHAFSEPDVRLLETLANSMSVALENARLFDETQRLLKETEDRAAELAVINSVQEGLASKLDFAGIIDLVGDKLRGIFDAQITLIALVDDADDDGALPHMWKMGSISLDDAFPLGEGLTSHVISSGKQLVINENSLRLQ